MYQQKNSKVHLETEFCKLLKIVPLIQMARPTSSTPFPSHRPMWLARPPAPGS